ncbi:helix-turn-helix domain-containing protein [Streptomyces sp. NPDC051555]|uniref:helix-turn-helix domain-containing protein n=1 Tax=Streptomyces sp. NPDC051555 TaxID=3365657 RepID=UPI0037B99B02
MRLANLREQAGLTQAEVAARLGTAQPNVSRLERLPVEEISQRQLRRYLQVLDTRLVLIARDPSGQDIVLTAP